MDKSNAKKAFTEAEKQVTKEEVDKLKDVIKHTLEKLKEKEEAKRALQEDINILKADIKDFKEGRLDKVEERQKNNPNAKAVSVFKIVRSEPVKDVTKVEHHYYNYPIYWTYPYTITPTLWPPQFDNSIVYDIDVAGMNNDAITLNTRTLTVDTGSASFSCSGSTARSFTSGTYQLEDGSVKMI